VITEGTACECAYAHIKLTTTLINVLIHLFICFPYHQVVGVWHHRDDDFAEGAQQHGVVTVLAQPHGLLQPTNHYR